MYKLHKYVRVTPNHLGTSRNEGVALPFVIHIELKYAVSGQAHLAGERSIVVLQHKNNERSMSLKITEQGHLNLEGNSRDSFDLQKLQLNIFARVRAPSCVRFLFDVQRKLLEMWNINGTHLYECYICGYFIFVRITKNRFRIPRKKYVI